MKIGIAFDLKPKTPLPDGAPDDLHEEFDSPETVTAIAAAIRGMGHTPIEVGGGRAFIEAMLADPTDLVFNLAEGTGHSRNREARVPAVCEMLGIPHTGSDVLTLALCLDKDMARRVVAEAGVVVPKGILLTPPAEGYDGDGSEYAALVAEGELALPLIAKPACEGSSKGIRSKCLIETAAEIGPIVASLWKDYGQAVLLEEFIAGEEVTVGVWGNDPPQVMGVMRVVPRKPTKRFVYSLEVKRDWDPVVTYESPAQLPGATIVAIEDSALSAFMALGCRDLARIDFRVRDGVPYFIEANPLPGLNPVTSDLCLLAKGVNVTHPQIIQAVIEATVRRNGTLN